jgi:hypothetical protein
MKYIVKNTRSLDSVFWKGYKEVFNETFGTSFTEAGFASKYASPTLGESFHALCFNDDGALLGATSIVPLNYSIDGEKVLGGLSCDSFVIKNQRRENPFMLRALLSNVESYASDNGVKFVIAVPNENSYRYTTRFCKWIMIGEYEFYCVPVGVRTIAGHNIIGGCISLLVSKVAQLLISIGRYSRVAVDKRIKIIQDESYLGYRLNQAKYYYTQKSGYNFIYRIYNESGVMSAYLLDCQPRSPLGFRFALQHILKQHNKEIDVILHLGIEKNLSLPVLKIPKKFKPRAMRFLVRILDEKYNCILNIDNWELGIILMDTR